MPLRPLATLAVAVVMATSAWGATPFTLWVTESPGGGSVPYNDQNPGGLRSYYFDGLGYAAANYSAGTTVASSLLNDPAGVIVEPSGSLLVSNRGFNTGTGSVSRVSFAGTIPSATVVLADIDTGPHQAALTGGGDLIVSSSSSGGRLYPGIGTPATVFYDSGLQRGTIVGGSLLYAASASDMLQTFNIASGATAAAPFSVLGASSLHYGTLFDGSLYLADPVASAVFKVTLDGAGLPSGSSKVADVAGATAVVFSPSGDEMFVSGNQSGVITGFAVTAGTVAGTANLSIDGGTLAAWGGEHVMYGGLAVAVIPEPSTCALMGAGLLILIGRVRHRT